MESNLNPEAAEFIPHLIPSITQAQKDVTEPKPLQDDYLAVTQSVNSSNDLNYGPIVKTYTDYGFLTRNLGENIDEQTKRIIKAVPSVRLNLKSDQYNIDNVTDINDQWVDNAIVHMEYIVNPKTEGQATCSSAPVLAEVQAGSTTLIAAMNVWRPQLNFKDPIDNTPSLWVPKITDKPNNVKPLALRIIHNEKGEAIGYEHPYKAELDIYKPPRHFIEPDPHPPILPPPPERTTLTIVKTEELLNELVSHLKTVQEIAVDVEHHSYRTYQGITCLIQLTTIGGDFVIDALALREHLNRLNISFTDPTIMKVFHGADNDVIWLQRDFGVYLVGLFDTHQAARLLKLPGCSLKDLLMKYCGVHIDKKYQLADWRIRPLPEELLHYARMDTHYLLYIYHCMKSELLVKGEHQLLTVYNKSRRICGETYVKSVLTDSSHLSLYKKTNKEFNHRQLAALRFLYKWRDSLARDEDESSIFILPDHLLLSLAEAMPSNLQDIMAICGRTSSFAKQNMITLHRMLFNCRELPIEPEVNKTPPAAHMTQQRVLSHNVHDLLDMPQYIDKNVTSEPVVLNTEGADSLDMSVLRIPIEAVMSDLNFDAKMFLSPYDRYRKYRSLAQLEQIEKFKEEEVRLAVLSK